MSAVGEARCAIHPEAQAVDVCTRCGAFACSTCIDYFDDSTAYCSRCAAGFTSPAPWLVKCALAFSLLGAMGMLAGVVLQGRLGLATWALAIPSGLAGAALVLVSRAAQRQKPLLATRPWLWAAQVSATLHLLLVVALVGAFLFFLARQRT